jgi:hypothetical protein
MPRLVRLFAALLVAGVATPAFACRTSGVGIQLGGLFVGFAKHRPCPPPVIVAQPLPPVAAYTQPQPVYVVPPPPVYVVPAPAYVAPPPPVVYSPPPVFAAPAPVVVQQRAAPAADSRPGFLALKYMPGVSSGVSLTGGEVNFADVGFAHSPGIELRLTRWLSVRSDLEFRQSGRTWDMLGVKGSLFPNSPVKPYASVSFAGNESYANPGKYSFGFAAAAGLDVFFGKHFFLEAEARYRVTPGACCAEVPSVTGVVGGGVAFF